MTEANNERLRYEALLAKPQFIRSFAAMNCYQRLCAESKDDPAALGKLKERMYSRFMPRERADADPDHAVVRAEYRKIQEQILAWCEQGEFSVEKAAELLANSSIADIMITGYSFKPGERNHNNNLMVNDTIDYCEHDDPREISLNIVPAATRGWDELVAKIIDGFKKIAIEMESGKLQHVEKIFMQSWLLAPAFENKVRKLLGDDIKIEEVVDDDGTVEQIQSLALSYNERSAEEYLRTGKLPEVRQVVMTRDEFIRKFR